MAMTYNCDCGDYDCEFYWPQIRKARKEHKCCECGGKILPGEQYEHVRGKWHGYVDSFNTCGRCVDLRTWVKNNVPCLCIMHGNQDEENYNAIDDARWRAKEETVGLYFGYLRRKHARDKLNDARRKAA